MVSEIQAGQTFSRHLPAQPPIRTPWVKTIPRHSLWAVGLKTITYIVSSSGIMWEISGDQTITSTCFELQKIYIAPMVDFHQVILSIV